ncbi:hypothetical protein STEG23_034085 [Scotinomys teguina]
MIVSHRNGCGEPDLGSLEEQHALLTTEQPSPSKDIIHKVEWTKTRPHCMPSTVWAGPCILKSSSDSQINAGGYQPEQRPPAHHRVAPSAAIGGRKASDDESGKLMELLTIEHNVALLSTRLEEKGEIIYSSYGFSITAFELLSERYEIKITLMSYALKETEALEDHNLFPGGGHRKSCFGKESRG